MGVTVRRVCCQSCGADLDVPEGVRYLNCNYCHSKLEVVDDHSITHTRLLESVARETREMAGNLRVIELQNDIARLDREWAAQRETYLTRDSRGHPLEPSSVGSSLGGFVAILGGLFWMIFTASILGSGLFPFFGLIIIGIGIYSLTTGGRKAANYQEARNRYLSARQKLIHQLDSTRNRT